MAQYKSKTFFSGGALLRLNTIVHKIRGLQGTAGIGSTRIRGSGKGSLEFRIRTNQR